MFKLAIISTLATSAVNALELEADADTMYYRRKWADPHGNFKGISSRSIVVKQRNFVPIGYRGRNNFYPPRGRRFNSGGRRGPRVALVQDRLSTCLDDSCAGGGLGGFGST